MATIGIERATGLGRLDVTALANAATTVGAVAYLICAALALVAPDLLMGLFQTWAHGISVAALRPATPGFGAGAFAIGLVTFSGAVWLATAATAWLYNRWGSR
jgi:hypothetical protein